MPLESLQDDVRQNKYILKCNTDNMKTTHNKMIHYIQSSSIWIFLFLMHFICCQSSAQEILMCLAIPVFDLGAEYRPR